MSDSKRTIGDVVLDGCAKRAAEYQWRRSYDREPYPGDFDFHLVIDGWKGAGLYKTRSYTLAEEECEQHRRDWDRLMAAVIQDRGESAGPTRYAIVTPSQPPLVGLYAVLAFPTREEAVTAWRKHWLGREDG